MKIMVTWSVRPGGLEEAVSRFLATGGMPKQEGVKILGRWHRTDGGGGFTLYETDSPAAMYAGAVEWADLMELDSYVVIEDAEAAPALMKQFGK